MRFRGQTWGKGRPLRCIQKSCPMAELPRVKRVLGRGDLPVTGGMQKRGLEFLHWRGDCRGADAVGTLSLLKCTSTKKKNMYIERFLSTLRFYKSTIGRDGAEGLRVYKDGVTRSTGSIIRGQCSIAPTWPPLRSAHFCLGPTEPSWGTDSCPDTTQLLSEGPGGRRPTRTPLPLGGSHGKDCLAG